MAINEITEAADVGFGSFYNHFESKEAIYAALLDWAFKDFADAMERVLGEISDSAEVIAVSVRYTMLRALREPVLPTRKVDVARSGEAAAELQDLPHLRVTIPVQ